MQSKAELSKMDINYLLHPVSVLQKHEESGPRIIVEGDGVRIKDIEGKEYIDAFSGMWNVVTGYGQRSVNEAITEELSKLHYFSPFYGFSTSPAIELAAKVVNMMPQAWNMGKVLFTCGGSETNDTNLFSLPGSSLVLMTAKMCNTHALVWKMDYEWCLEKKCVISEGSI